MLVLAVEREQPAGELAQLAHGDRAAAEVGPRATVGPTRRASTSSLASAGSCSLRRPSRELEHAFDVGLRGAWSDDPGARPPAEQEIQRVGQHRLAGAGLAGDHVEAADQLEASLLDQQ